MKLLIDEIAEYDVQKKEQVPSDILQIMDQATKDLKSAGVENNALKTHDTAVDFSLKNHIGKSKSLKDYLDASIVILSFYRGGWCPYCNMELHALQALLPEIENTGAKLVAISPEVPDHSLSTHEKNELAFDILYDQGNKVASEYGLVFKLPEVLRPIYDNFGLDIPDHNGDETFDLPMPATYIINQKGKIIYHFVDSDYTKRAEPSKLIDVISKMVNA
jgi:peroxiredoxin